MITHSLIIAAVESYAMVEKQMRIFADILPENWELIFVDDGSVPPIKFPKIHPRAFLLFGTGTVRKPGEWTQKLAINQAVPLARGEYILKSDIDHVFTWSAIDAANRFRGDMMLFHRRLGFLRDDLRIDELPNYLTSPSDDIWLMRKSLFLELGGYPAEFARRYGAGGSPFWEYSQRPEAQPPDDALIYAIPDTFEDYHNLPRVPAREDLCVSQ